MSKTHFWIPSLLACLLCAIASPAQAYLGVAVSGEEGGARVTRVVDGSPAATAGLAVGDVILKLDDREIASAQGLIDAVAAASPGDRVRTTLLRRGRSTVVPVSLGRRPAGVELAPPSSAARREAAATPEAAAQETAREPREAVAEGTARAPQEPVAQDGDDPEHPAVFVGVGLRPAGSTFVVTRVLDESPAQLAGVRVGDSIHRWGNRELAGLEALDGYLATLVPGDICSLHGERDGQPLRVRLRVGRVGEPGRRLPGTEVAEASAARSMAAAAGAPIAHDAPRAVPELRSEELARARATGRPVLAVFGASWSSSSQAFRRTLDAGEVSQALSGFERVWLDSDTHKADAAALGVQGLPRVLVLDGDEIVFDHTGYMTAGQVIKEVGRLAPKSPEDRLADQLDDILERVRDLETRVFEVDRRDAAAVRSLRGELAEILERIRKLR